MEASRGARQPVTTSDHGDRSPCVRAKVLSQQTESGRLDWRRSYHELLIEPCEIPDILADRCREVLARLGLVFGCSDFVVTPSRNSFFLSFNEGGQFLFVENYCGLPLLDAFAELLAQGRPDFAWPADGPQVHYREVREAVQGVLAWRSKAHVQPPDRSVWEGSGTTDLPRNRRRLARA